MRDETLHQIRGIIKARPGIHAREIHRGMLSEYRPKSFNTVIYHLELLEEHGFIKKVKERNYLKFYLTDIPKEKTLKNSLSTNCRSWNRLAYRMV